jgi:hypothetical protein
MEYIGTARKYDLTEYLLKEGKLNELKNSSSKKDIDYPKLLNYQLRTIGVKLPKEKYDFVLSCISSKEITEKEKINSVIFYQLSTFLIHGFYAKKDATPINFEKIKIIFQDEELYVSTKINYDANFLQNLVNQYKINRKTKFGFEIKDTKSNPFSSITSTNVSLEELPF